MPAIAIPNKKTESTPKTNTKKDATGIRNIYIPIDLRFRFE